VNDQSDFGERREFYVLAGAIVVDNFTLFITGILCIAVVLTAFLLDDYTRREGLEGPEWYALVLLSASGGVLLASAEDLIVSFVGLEILSIAVYVLAALHLRRSESQEAGFKYFVLGALSSAVFLYGIALVYGATGSTRLADIDAALFATGINGQVPAEDASLLLVGIAFLLVGFGFKVSAAPFHVWTPDVYQGAPTPIVAFMASAVKVAAFGGFLRVFLYGFDGVSEEWLPLIAAMAMLTLVIGAFFAVVQTNVKRMMAYSSITHAGFMLIGLHSAAQDVAGDVLGSSAILFYLFTYSLTVIGSFAVITVVGGRGDGAHDLESYRGLAKREPLLASLFTVLLFAQAGIPFTSGFFAKFRVIAAAASDESYWLAGVAMLAAAVAAYLYLRLVVLMFMGGSDEHDDVAGHDEMITASSVGAAASDLGDPDGADGAEVAVIERLDVPPSVLVVLVVSAAAAIVWGVLPDVGGSFLDDAAATLTLLRP
jgi:NADH-quinone oxidoreductase subunit N